MSENESTEEQSSPLMHGHAYDFNNNNNNDIHNHIIEMGNVNGKAKESSPPPSSSSLVLSASSLSSPASSPSHSSSAPSSSLSLPPSHTSQLPALTIRCFCFDMTHCSPQMRFAILSSGVFLFFMLNSYVEEFLFSDMPNFSFGWYLTFFELLCFTCFAIIERRLLGEGDGVSTFGHRAALSRHFLVALAMTMSRGLTNQSLQYLNYPTQVIFKSMKLITVMIGSVVCLRQQYTVLEYISAVLLVVSAMLFSLGDVDVQPRFSNFGLIVVILSLVADAVHTNSQESLVRHHNASTLETMLFTNLFSAAISFGVVVLIGEFGPAFTFCLAQPSVYFLFVIRAIVIYGGVFCFVTLIKSSGAVVATGVTTVRKILTILASFVLFPKPMSSKYVWGTLVFAVAVSLSVIVAHQQQQSKNEKLRLEKLSFLTHAEKRKNGSHP